MKMKFYLTILCLALSAAALDYQLQEEIGAGSFSHIYVALSTSQVPVAVKIPVNPNSEIIFREFEIHKNLDEKDKDHVFISRYYTHGKRTDLIDSSKFPNLPNYECNVIVSEYFPYGDMFSLFHVKELNKIQLKNVLRDVVLAVSFMHDQGICHGDMYL